MSNPTTHFPVVYMHDGQNLRRSSASTESLARAGRDNQGRGRRTVREADRGGIGNTADRIRGTPPPMAATERRSGRVSEFVVTELKPQIDQRLRKQRDRLDTGSSARASATGSACAGIWHPDVFGLVGAMSPFEVVGWEP